MPRIVAHARMRAAQETAGRSRELHAERLQVARDRLEEAEQALRDDAEIRVDLPGTAVPAGWSQLLRLVEEKARHYGRTFARIGRFEPTSQVCSACGVKDGPKPLRVREWQCPACGAHHDRDVNAARNILAAGRAERLNACGGSVRPGLALAAPGEAGTHRSAA
jgi:putative transposase